ncbi:6-O-methylguanine DNA methyltransferase [Abortiporus biennis]|nr:6-O-methylguanine DNA methyltransferase [Abortiporus biennis]
MESKLSNEIPPKSTKDHTKCPMRYPLSGLQRECYKTKSGKTLSDKQWAIYDYVRTIPCGKVTTYKSIADALGFGSARSVGGAMRNNPFAPYVPCHRVIASNLFIGGFYGEWGIELSKKSASSGKRLSNRDTVPCQKKMRMLKDEGVKFSKDGYLVDKEHLWNGN